MSDKHFRRWLDPHAEVDSYVHITVNSYTNKKTGKTYHRADLKLADCTRSVEIGFSSGNKVSWGKLERLEAALAFLRKEMKEWDDA